MHCCIICCTLCLLVYPHTYLVVSVIVCVYWILLLHTQFDGSIEPAFSFYLFIYSGLLLISTYTFMMREEKLFYQRTNFIMCVCERRAVYHSCQLKQYSLKYVCVCGGGGACVRQIPQAISIFLFRLHI